VPEAPRLARPGEPVGGCHDVDLLVHLVVRERRGSVDDRAAQDAGRVARGKAQDVWRTAAPAVDGEAAHAEVIEDRGEVVSVLREPPARESRRDTEPGALDGDHPQPALHPG
jgi:hypothetical protein